MKRKIMVVGVPWSVHELAPAARDALRRDATLHVADTAEALRLVDPAVPCERLTLDRLGLAQVVEAARALRPDCVVSLTEMTMELAAAAREAIAHPGTPAATERTVADKPATRRALRSRGLTGVGFWETTVAGLPALLGELEPPVVVKPCALTGSAGVRIVTGPDDVAPLLARYTADAGRYGRDRLLVETYLPGPEVSAEGMVVDGKFTLYTVTDKVTTEAPHFIEIGHAMPGRHSARWHAPIADYLQACADALGIVTSPIHAELKLGGDRPELVEIHTRFGGDDIVHLLERAFGLAPFERYFAAMLDGESAPPPEPGRTWGVGFFTGAVDRPFGWRSYAFPRPDAVVSLDLDAGRPPRLCEYEGVRLLHRRAGRALFASDDPAAVLENLLFMREQAVHALGERPEAPA